MRAPASLFAISVATLVFSLTSPVWADLVLVAGPGALGSLYLIWKAHKGTPPAKAMVILDGSNVMHWSGNGADLSTVKALAQLLEAEGLQPGVIFDANVGYKFGDRYLDDRHLARALKMPEDRVLVVPKGTPADQYILEAARKLKARVVTNDRYRDWAERFPEVSNAGFLIRGGIADGKPWVEKGPRQGKE